MNVEILSRIQFAVVALFHFLFVPLTLGLSTLVAFMESRYVATGNETYLRMAKYWGRLFIINFAVGVVTGITLEFQFGMNWAQYSTYVGNIFGAPLAIEATVAFFLESTMIGLWVFSWNRVSKQLHSVIIWLVALASTLSALWILLANGWMQHPVGYLISGGEAQLQSFSAVLFNPFSWVGFFHTMMAAYVVGSFFVMGISAFHLLRRSQVDLFKRSFNIAAVLALLASVLVIFAGDLSGRQVADHQPTKLAGFEGQWTTERHAPFYLISFPNPKAESNYIDALGIPGGLSFLSYHNFQATVKGLKSFPVSDRPPIVPIFIAFRLMVALGFLFLAVAILAVIYSRKNALEKNRWFLHIMPVALFLPYLSCELGWIVTEMGRQPWIVYGLLRTQDAVSLSIRPGDVIASIVGFLIIYSLLAITDVFLITKHAKRLPVEGGVK